MVLFGSSPTDFKVVEYKNDYKKLLYVTFTEPYSALLARLDAVKKSVEKVKAPSLNTVWNAPGRWNPTKWRGLSTSATKTFRFVDIDGNAIKKQFRYVAKSYDRKWTICTTACDPSVRQGVIYLYDRKWSICTTGSDPSVRQEVIYLYDSMWYGECLYDIVKRLHHSIDRLIYRWWGGNGRDYCFFFFWIYVFS